MDHVTIASARLSASINALGAELQHLSDHDGRQLQWNGDPAVWHGRAPILFPIIGLLQNGVYRLDDRSYAMPKHGFARHSVFDIIDHTPEAVTFHLAASAETRAIYPFDFTLDIRFSLSGAELTLAATITNNGATSMPASFGFHPALRWPLPYGRPRADHRIRFERDESAPVRRIDASGFLLPEPQPTPTVGDTLTLRDELFVDDALIFDRLASKRVIYGAATGPQLAVDFADFPTLSVWTKPAADFICIEPWQGFSDPVGFAGDIRDKPGIIEIAPQDSRRLAMRLSLLDDA